MYRLVYIGIHDSVDVPLPYGGSVRAKRDGDPIEVGNSLGERLLEQPKNWFEEVTS